MESVSRICFGVKEKRVKGVCGLCGEVETSEFIPINKIFSENFVYYPKIKTGNLCFECSLFFQEEKFRKSCFFATPHEVEFLKAKEVFQKIISNTEYPFIAYITKSFKRQGWLSGWRNISFFPEKIYIHTDFVGCVETSMELLIYLSNLFQKLIQNNIPKSAVVSQENISVYKKIVEKNLITEFETLKKFRNTGILEVLAYVL